MKVSLFYNLKIIYSNEKSNILFFSIQYCWFFFCLQASKKNHLQMN